MELLLWRHADAEYGPPDQERRLTEKGERQAAKVANWLKRHAPEDLRIIAGPSARTRQTADALGLAYTTSEEVGTTAGPEDLLHVASWPFAGGAVMLVGHQPTLGDLAAQLLDSAGSLTIRKGALWWFSCRYRAGAAETSLRTVIAPGLLDD